MSNMFKNSKCYRKLTAFQMKGSMKTRYHSSLKIDTECHNISYKRSDARYVLKVVVPVVIEHIELLIFFA